MKLTRLFGKPIITPETSPPLGDNIDGPTLIKVPDWVENKLGKYYLYFAHHEGSYIRLAYSDYIEGPWQIYEPGVFHVDQIPWIVNMGANGHVASPEIYIDEENKQFLLYYHGGLILPKDEKWVEENKDASVEYLLTCDAHEQHTFVAVSKDGIHFTDTGTQVSDGCYLRVIPHEGYLYSFEQLGQVRRTKTGLDVFEKGPVLFRRWDQRHLALLKRDNLLYVLHTIRGEKPESIVVSTIDISKDWMEWEESDYTVLLKPETDYEGADLPLTKSGVGPAKGRENALRDPAIYEEDGRIYVLYAIAGESGIAVAELFLDS